MATKSIAWDTGGGNITLTYTGQGNGTITVESDPNELGSARSQTVTVQAAGGVITRNLTISQAACPVPVGTVLEYPYTGSYQEVTLPAGQYKLQCWGAQGGSNAAASSYGIKARAGGKGGYSEGVITLIQPTTFRVYVGGQGSSSAGGFNGGGSTTGSSSYNASSENGVSRMGGGGGATDIRLSDAQLLSRMIVAGGGSGGAMCYRSKTTSSTSTTEITSGYFTDGIWVQNDGSVVSNPNRASTDYIPLQTGDYVYKVNGNDAFVNAIVYNSSKQSLGSTSWPFTATSSYKYVRFVRYNSGSYSSSYTPAVPYIQRTTSSTSTSRDSQVGYAGGGTTGGGYSDTYKGKQNAAGSNGSFGQGAAMSASNYRYCSGAGGGGLYGGGAAYSDSSMSYVRYMGGGSGWVNIAANAGNRPSGYNGLQLDSGTTYAGDTSFPNTAGTGNETGHAGNGYAKITRLS